MAGLVASAASTLFATTASTLQTVGTIVGGVGAVSSGIQANKAAKFQANVLEQQAQSERAIASREAGELIRQKELRQSRARAVGAASGGGVDFDVIGDIEEVGELNALTALWQGANTAQGLEAQADVSRFEGRQYKKAGYLKGISTILTDGASLYDKYGTA